MPQDSELRNSVVEYCDSILARTAESLNKSSAAIEETRKSVLKKKA